MRNAPTPLIFRAPTPKNCQRGDIPPRCHLRMFSVDHGCNRIGPGMARLCAQFTNRPKSPSFSEFLLGATSAAVISVLSLLALCGQKSSAVGGGCSTS